MQHGICQQMNLRYSYAHVLHYLPVQTNKSCFRKTHGIYKDFTLCCIAVECSTPVTVSKVTAFAHVLGLQEIMVIPCLLL